MSTLFDIIRQYVLKYHKEENSNTTMETFNIIDNQRKGKIELKWWKEKGTLIIRYIFLETPTNPSQRNLLSNTIKSLGANDDLVQKGLRKVRLDTIGNESLYQKLIDQGWSSLDGCLDIYL